jgi:hypothetical protein
MKTLSIVHQWLDHSFMALGPQKTKAEIEVAKYNRDWDRNDDIKKENIKINGHRGGFSAGVLIRPSEYGPGGWSDRLVTESRRTLSGGENRSAAKL